MRSRGAQLIRTLTVAAATAMLVSALPASAVTAATAPVACKVHDLNQGTDRDSLQRAVLAADPGDALLVQGTCTGTTLIDKDLSISTMGWAGASLPLGSRYVTSPRGQLRSGSWRPALVIDPSVDDFSINPGLRVDGGIVVGDIDEWRGDAQPVPVAWASSVVTPSAPDWRASLSSCYVLSDSTGDQYRSSGAAALDASAGDHLSLRGTCDGETVVSEDLHLSGWRMAISSTRLGSPTSSSEDSGPPTLTRVTVDDDVHDLVIREIRLTNGFHVKDLGT